MRPTPRSVIECRLRLIGSVSTVGSGTPVSCAPETPQPPSPVPCYVRVNGARVDGPGRVVRTGDVVTVALDSRVRVLKVKGVAERRGPRWHRSDAI